MERKRSSLKLEGVWKKSAKTGDKSPQITQTQAVNTELIQGCFPCSTLVSGPGEALEGLAACASLLYLPTDIPPPLQYLGIAMPGEHQLVWGLSLKKKPLFIEGLLLKVQK